MEAGRGFQESWQTGGDPETSPPNPLGGDVACALARPMVPRDTVCGQRAPTAWLDRQAPSAPEPADRLQVDHEATLS